MACRFGHFIVIAALGCGPSVGGVPSEEGGTDDDGSTSAMGGTGMSGASGRLDETGDDGPEATGGEGTGDAPEAGFCGAAHGSQPLAVLTTMTTAAVLRADGTTVDLDIGVGAVPPDATALVSADARGAYVGISLAWTLLGEGVQHGSEVSLFDANGGLLWRVSEPGANVGSLRVGAGGSIVALRDSDFGGFEGVVYEGGVARALPSFWPQAPLTDDGLVPGRYEDMGGTTYGWLRADDLAFVALEHEPLDNLVRVTNGGDYIYATADDPTPSLVRESPDGAEIFALEGVQVPAGDSIHVSSASSAEWLLLHGEDSGAPWFRVSVAGALAEPLELVPPRGVQWLECYAFDPAIDASGRILVPTRDEFAGRIQRLDPDTGAWQPIAEPVTRIDMLSVQVFGAATVVQSQGENTTFCPLQMFEPTRGILEGTTWQIEHDGVEHVLPADTVWLAVNPDGTCAAHAAMQSDTTTLLDLADRTELQLRGAYGVRWWQDP